MTSNSIGSWVSIVMVSLGSAACAAEVEPVGGEQAAATEEQALHQGGIVEREHFVHVGDGVRLHVREKFTRCGLARHPRRALMMITGTLVTNVQYDADVPGDPSFNALDRAAEACFIAVSPTFEGYGESTKPEDGRTVTAERLLPELGRVLEWVRHRHGVPKVDLMGASLGSALAVALGGVNSPIPRHHVNKIVLTANVYKDVTPLFREIFFSPELRALLETPPGYLQTAPEAYGIILASAEPAAAEWAASAFPGVYATGPTLEGFELPAFPAEDGRAPVLQFWGDQDLITPYSDVETFAAEYGGPIRVEILEGGGHTAIFEPVRDEFWRETFAFLNSRHHPHRVVPALNPAALARASDAGESESGAAPVARRAAATPKPVAW